MGSLERSGCNQRRKYEGGRLKKKNRQKELVGRRERPWGEGARSTDLVQSKRGLGKDCSLESILEEARMKSMWGGPMGGRDAGRLDAEHPRGTCDQFIYKKGKHISRQQTPKYEKGKEIWWGAGNFLKGGGGYRHIENAAGQQ